MRTKLFTLATFGLLMASCSNELRSPEGDDGAVTFRAELPSGFTRAFGDGTKATSLQALVYDAKTSTYITTENATFSDGSANVTVQLAAGSSYKVVFWADKGTDSPYTINTDNGKVTLDYTKVAGNSDDADAFYALAEVTPRSDREQTVNLRRPLAQINFGTDDMDAEDLKRVYGENLNIYTQIQYEASNSMNLLTGEVDATDASIKTVLTNIANIAEINSSENFPVTGYDYIGVAYALVPSSFSCDIRISAFISDAEGTESQHTVIVPGAPLKPNYRTNAFGSLLTKTTDFKVTINEVFTNPDNDIKIAETVEELLDAMEQGNDIVIPENKELDLSEIEDAKLEVDKPLTITVEKDAELKVSDKVIEVASTGDLVIKGAGRITNVDDEAGALRKRSLTRSVLEEGDAKKLFHVKDGGKLVLEGVELVNDMDWHTHGDDDHPYNNAAISYWGTSEVEITNCKIYTGGFAICGMANTGKAKVTVKDCYLESNSSNIHGHYSYCVRARGQVTFENCTIVGVQGGVSPDGWTADGTIVHMINCDVSTHHTEGKTDAFYPIYATSDAQVIIDGGSYYCPIDRSGNIAEGTSALVTGDNDDDEPDGYIIINSGKFSGKAYNIVNNVSTLIDLPEGKQYVAIEGDDKYKWEVK